MPLWLIGVPGGGALPLDGFSIKTSLTGQVLQVLFLANDKRALDDKFPKIISKLADDAVFWIGYPKKSSGIISDLLETKNWNIVFDMGYRIVSSAAIDDTWAGVRIRKVDPQTNYKSSIPMEARKTEGIDYVNRTVKLPKDAIKAMQPFHGLERFFDEMSFTHKKEYVEAIAEAKKPETRQRRIDKMIEMLIALRIKKEKK